MADFYYFVEGDCEKNLLEDMKRSKIIQPGRIEVFNVVQNSIKSKIHIMKSGSTVVFVFDTDKGNPTMLLETISRIKRIVSSSRIICLPQVLDFEDELERSCSGINDVREINKTKSVKDFKSRFQSCFDPYHRLIEHGFDVKKMWTTKVPASFDKIRQYVKPELIIIRK